MTTSHKPTYHPAIGSANQGSFRYHAARQQFSAKDIAAHTNLKFRATGQGSASELAARDLKAELEERERLAKESRDEAKKKAGLLPYAEKTVDANKLLEATDWKKFDDSDDDDEDEDGSDSDDDNSDDEAAELKKELERIKAEKREEAERKAAEANEEEKSKLNEEVLSGNPLLNPQSFAMKRRWDDDVVFKNQSRDQKKVAKRFINDTIRSDFHRNFLKKYIQ